MRKKTMMFILTIFLLIMTIGCSAQPNQDKEQDLLQVKSTKSEQKKKVIYLLVDSLMAQSIDRGIQQDILPTMKYLIEHGQYYKNMVSSFPTMSVTIDSSLFTGAYPDGHRVPGLTWYSKVEKKLINYGTGPVEVIRLGVDSVLVNTLMNLNGGHLNPQLPTIHEDLHTLGLKSSSINGIIYRGTIEHNLTIPPFIDVPTSLPRKITVKGPDYLSLGAFSDPLKDIETLSDGLIERLGLNNNFSIQNIKFLIRENKLPDFSFVYLPDLDQKLHRNGPNDLDGLKELDSQIASVLLSFGSAEEALKKATLIITGDSGMSQIKSAEDNPSIELTSFFNDYHVLKPDEAVTDSTQIALAINETMAYVYSLQMDKLSDIANLLRTDSRVDVISWKENDWIHVIQGGDSTKELKYQTNGKLIDSYQQKWKVEGDTDLLDLKINNNKQSIAYGKYPDGLQRLSGALNSHHGNFLVVTAKSGYEFSGNSSPLHIGGGGHGSLDEEVSLVPLIICGSDQKPQHLRIVDLKSYILKLLAE